MLISSVTLLLISFVYIQENRVKLILFIIAGILHGIYYGKNNNLIFHYPHNEKPPVSDNHKAVINRFWVHLVCSIVGTIAMYFLSKDLSVNELSDFNQRHFILFVVAILGYTGLLPMTLWFFANSGKILERLLNTNSP